jgi:lysophospholipase L1-like esterase
VNLVRIWVTTIQPLNTTPQGVVIAETLRDRIRQEFGSRAIDFWTPLAGPDGQPLPAYLNAYDNLHPNAEGHRLLFEQVVAAGIPAALVNR